MEEGTYTTEDVHEAARQAQAHEFIMEMKDGYATRVGERGGRISGGQRQRIAIARVFLRKPKIILLDGKKCGGRERERRERESERDSLIEATIFNPSRARSFTPLARLLTISLYNLDRKPLFFSSIVLSFPTFSQSSQRRPGKKYGGRERRKK